MEQLPAKRDVPEYIQESLRTLEGSLEYARTLLRSKLCPDHFYEKKIVDNKKVVDYEKGRPEAALIVLQHGMEVGMSISQSLQQIIPVRGLMSIKGDGAKSLIFSSGKLKAGTWVEKPEGTIEAGTYKVTITATRSDNGETLTRSFSITDAIRAGLWITNGMLKGRDGWRLKLSSWFKYPERMIKYRALGFLARDLFPDVMCGMVTKEEAEDYPPEGEVVTKITTKDGKKLQITPQLEGRSNQVTDDTVKKIDKAKVEPEKKAGLEKGEPSDDLVKYTEEELLTMGPKIYSLAESFTYKEDKLNFWIEKIPGKKSNRKYRLAILAFQDDIFDKYLEREIGAETIKESGKELKSPPETTQKNGEDKDIDKILDETPGQVEKASKKEAAKEESREITDFEKEFDKGGPIETRGSESEDSDHEPNETNKQGIEISDLPEDGERVFDQVKFIYDKLNKLTVDNNTWLAITKGHPLGQLYKSKEDFCRRAGKNEINELLNSI